MGDSMSCCSQPEKSDLTTRELVTLESGDACLQATKGMLCVISDFFDRFPRIKEIYMRKPNYCYGIDRMVMFQKEGMTCIGQVPPAGRTG